MPDAFVRTLIPSNLALAGRCAAQPGLSIPERLRRELQTLLIERTRDPQADLRSRIAAGKAQGDLGDPRLKEQPVRADVKPLLPVFAAIPGGEYLIGLRTEMVDPRDLILDGFELAIHPVTNSEFARFVEAGGYRDDAYWPGRALAWCNGLIGQEDRHRQIREDRLFFRYQVGTEATAEVIRSLSELSLTDAKWWQERISAGDEEFEAWLRETYPRPKGPLAMPAYWRTPTWGNPAQPVVGVCWYEARAYCLWLNCALSSERYRLPSEAE